MLAGALTKRPSVTDGLKIHLENFKAVELPVPSPKSGELLIKVAGSSVNPIDWKLLETPVALAWHYPAVLGSDCAGTVVSLGTSVSKFKVGDAVWADAFINGACYGQYAILKESITALAPTKIALPDVAVLPLVSLTGLDAFKFAKAPWSEGKTVVVLGGSGGTGHVGIQIAKAWGAAKVIATCGTSNLPFCASMGADQVIDYHKADWFSVLKPRTVDVIYDTVGLGGTGKHAFDILKDGGFFITTLPTALASPVTILKRPSVKQTAILTNSKNPEDLETLKDLVDAGKLRPHVERAFAISDLSGAINASMSGHTVGKISVVPTQKQHAIALVV